MITISIILPFVLSKNTLLTDLARHAPQPCLISPGFFWFFFLQGHLWPGEYFSLHSYQIQGELNSPAPFPDWRELPFIELLLCATYFTFYYMLTTVLGLFALVFGCFLPQSVVGCSADRAALPRLWPWPVTCLCLLVTMQRPRLGSDLWTFLGAFSLALFCYLCMRPNIIITINWIRIRETQIPVMTAASTSMRKVDGILTLQGCCGNAKSSMGQSGWAHS